MVLWHFNSDGSVDIDFGVDYNIDNVKDGYVYYDGGVERDIGYDVNIDSAGNVIVIGSTVQVSLDFEDTAIWRYTSSGVLDTSFGTNGLIYHNNANDRLDKGLDMAFDSLGNMYICGTSDVAGNTFIVYKLK